MGASGQLAALHKTDTLNVGLSLLLDAECFFFFSAILFIW